MVVITQRVRLVMQSRKSSSRLPAKAMLIYYFLGQRGKRRHYFQSIEGLNTSTIKALGAALRYRLNSLPDAPFFRPMPKKKASISFDKLITRGDVAAYAAKLKSVVD